MAIGPIGAHDREHEASDFPDSQDPRLAIVLPRIGAFQRESGEDLRGGGEIEAAVAEASVALGRIPVQTRRASLRGVYTLCNRADTGLRAGKRGLSCVREPGPPDTVVPVPYFGQPSCGRPGAIRSAFAKYTFFSTESGRSMPYSFQNA